MDQHHSGANCGLTRRKLAKGALALVLVPLLPATVRATPEGMAEAMRAALGADAHLQAGRVRLTLPELAENANVVSMRISVDSPMTPADHVTDVFVFSEKNPVPTIAHFYFTQRSGQARVQTHIRLAGSQAITAVARMTDGSLWTTSAEVIVTQGACFDGT